MVVAGDSFPNGASTPADCHRFCRCDAYELSIPDDGSVSADDLAALDDDALTALYAIGYLPSRHDRDVAAQQQADLSADTSDDEDEDEDEDEGDTDEEEPAVITPPPPPPKPKPRPRRRPRAH